MTDPKALTAERARLLGVHLDNGGKDAVSFLCGWDSALATREQTASTGAPTRLTEERRHEFWGRISNLQEATGDEDRYNTACDELDAFLASVAAPVEQAGSTPDETLREALADEAFALGMDARLRAAGFAGLLGEIRGLGAIRECDYPDLCERIDMAIADQERALARALATPTKPETPKE